MLIKHEKNKKGKRTQHIEINNELIKSNILQFQKKIFGMKFITNISID